MCFLKSFGGYGFRQIHELNLAFIGKLAWRLNSDPLSLAAHVLKAKYYPKFDFLHASLGSNPSYTWHGIFQT